MKFCGMVDGCFVYVLKNFQIFLTTYKGCFRVGCICSTTRLDAPDGEENVDAQTQLQLAHALLPRFVMIM